MTVAETRMGRARYTEFMTLPGHPIINNKPIQRGQRVSPARAYAAIAIDRFASVGKHSRATLADSRLSSTDILKQKLGEQQRALPRPYDYSAS